MVKYFYFLFLTASFAQVSDYAYTGAEATAMAGAIVSEKGGNWSIFHNPAGMTEIKGMHFSACSGKLYGFNWMPSNNLIGILPLPLIGKFGFALQEFEVNYGGTTLSKEQTLSISQGFGLQHDKNSRLSIGYTANFIRWDLGKSAGPSGDGSDGFELGRINSVSVDFGVLASLRKQYRFGVFLKNINSGAVGKGITREILPQRINTGITYMPMTELATSIVAEHLLGKEDLQIKGAIRYNLNTHIIIYSGVQFNPNRIGFGFKLHFGNQNNLVGNNLTITYSILSHPILPMTQQISVGFNL